MALVVAMGGWGPRRSLMRLMAWIIALIRARSCPPDGAAPPPLRPVVAAVGSASPGSQEPW